MHGNVMTKPLSTVSSLVHKRVSKAVEALGGLEDYHLKFISYFLKHELKLKRFTLAVNYESVPKAITIFVYDDDGKEVFLKPKQADQPAKIIEHLQLPLWELKFRERP
jgi:hypothetical protein